MIYAMGATSSRRAIVALPASKKARAGKLLRGCVGPGGTVAVTRLEDEIEVAKRNKGKVFYTEDGGDTWSLWSGNRR